MSCYGWESGTIILPSSAVAPLKKALVAEANASRDAVLALCKEFWTGAAKRTRSTKLYEQRLYEWMEAQYRAVEPSAWGSQTAAKGRRRAVLSDVHELLHDLSVKPRQVTAADVDALGMPKATNRTTRFPVGSEASITINGREVTWHVPENNHAVDRAHQHPLASALFRALDAVKWTRGSGGVIVGNNEYNRDQEYAGAGANYIAFAYGPRGEAERAHEIGISVAKYRQLRKPTTRPAAGRGYR